MRLEEEKREIWTGPHSKTVRGQCWAKLAVYICNDLMMILKGTDGGHGNAVASKGHNIVMGQACCSQSRSDQAHVSK